MARRDAARVFVAARDGRPMELDKRLKLGKLAGGLDVKGTVASSRKMTPMEAAMMGGHMECVKVLLSHGDRPGARVLPWMEGHRQIVERQQAELDALRARVAELEGSGKA